MHQNVGDAIEQIEMKLGTGASTPAANKALVSNGTASEWGQITGPMIANNAVGNDQLIASPTFTVLLPLLLLQAVLLRLIRFRLLLRVQ